MIKRGLVPPLLVLWSSLCLAQQSLRVGPVEGGGTLVTTQQLVRPAGSVLEAVGRPVDIAVAPDGKTVYVKDREQLLVVDAATWNIRQKLAYPSKMGATMHGLVIGRDGARLFLTLVPSRLVEAVVGQDGSLNWGRSILLPGLNEKRDSYPCALALSADESLAYVCLSMNNTLAVIDLKLEKPTAIVPVGVAPYDVALSPDGKTAYVTNWGGRHAREGEKTALSAGTPALVDDKGSAKSGCLSVIDLVNLKETSQVATGLHPAEARLSPDGKRLYVANANSDTVSVIDPIAGKVMETINVRPDESLPFGSASNALALSDDGQRLFVANGGNNAIAVVGLGQEKSRLQGFIPAGWYPGAIACRDGQLFIANVKGVGSRDPDPKQQAYTSRRTIGTIQKVAIPDGKALAEWSEQVKRDGLVPQALRAWEKAQSDATPLPVPMRVGEPSVFEHVVYIIKENRTYDQLFGDIKKGNGEEKLCIFPQRVSPNHHALAEQFVLLDNFYCNGVLSADGHAWVTEGITVDYLEKSFGGWSRSYPFGGNDPLAIAPTGFLWDNALLHGLSVRNYGEMTYTNPEPKNATWSDIYQDFKQQGGKVTFVQNTAVETLRQYTHPTYPGWNTRIPDAVRADIFLKEFRQFEQKGQLPNLTIMFLPQDHTSGTRAGEPTPEAMVADNDLALGRIVEAISQSQFWKKTCIFVIEDDPQAGFDHVDGHRSICLVISPYTKRNAVVSDFYNQTAVLHTMELILGLPPMNQMDALAPVMRQCFAQQPDFRPYTALPSNVALDQFNPDPTALAEPEARWARASAAQDFDHPDRADEHTLNQILWHAAKGSTTPYPAAWAGAHGRGLGALKLKLAERVEEDDD